VPLRLPLQKLLPTPALTLVLGWAGLVLGWALGLALALATALVPPRLALALTLA
jgi:hypothetical protein